MACVNMPKVQSTIIVAWGGFTHSALSRRPMASLLQCQIGNPIYAPYIYKLLWILADTLYCITAVMLVRCRTVHLVKCDSIIKTLSFWFLLSIFVQVKMSARKLNVSLDWTLWFGLLVMDPLQSIERGYLMMQTMQTLDAVWYLFIALCSTSRLVTENNM